MSRSPFAFDWVFEQASRRPEAPAIGLPGKRWTTYGALAGTVGGIAALLHDRRFGRGDFLVQALPPGLLAVAAPLAAQLLGGCGVEINREAGRDALAAVLGQTEARIALVQGRDVATWAPLARAHRLEHLLVVHPSEPPERMRALLQGISWSWLPEEGPPPVPPGDRAVRDPDAPALLVYTSGSTGTPRGVIQTHANIGANTAAICRYLELGPDDRALSILPLFYCYGKSVLQTHLFVGGSVFFDHRFMYPRVVMEAIEEERCTGFSGVPLTFEILRRQVDLSTIARSSLRYVTQAGGAMHPDTIRWARAAFAPARLFVMYGQTEATARLSYLPPERAADKEGSIGRGLDNVELRVVDEAGREVPPGVEGELVARGPSITPGYFRAPEETAAILRDGWLHTGDLARRDEDGFLYITGRTRDMLKLGGHRVSALEIEQVLARHPSVEEAAVVGVPDATGGEAAIAFVVAAAGAPRDEQALRRFCRENLPAFKVPREVRFVDDLPRTASGKVARSELQRRVS